MIQICPVSTDIDQVLFDVRCVAKYIDKCNRIIFKNPKQNLYGGKIISRSYLSRLPH